jgi:hypothetical protein
MGAHHVLWEATAAVRPGLEVADIFRLHGQEYRNNNQLSPQQIKAMRDIKACRTADLGGHVDVCDQGCGYTRISYNSCRNRNCPKCQGLQSAKWLGQRFERILPTHYFHMVFTVPHEVIPLILYNKRTLYTILFQSAAHSLLEFARDWERLQAQVGFTAILHTWNQDMQFHPHLHIVVTGGGLDQSQTGWISSPNNFLVPVRALSKKFRGKFMDLLKGAYEKGRLTLQENIPQSKASDAFHRLTRKLYGKKWVVYSKQPFGGPEQVFSYLGLYTHKVAISNHRLLSMADGKVTFLARDNANPGQKRSVSLSAHEFIRRFLLHILPHRFVKIRHYGLMAPRNAKTKLEVARRLIQGPQPQRSKTDSDCQRHTEDLSSQASWQELFFHISGIDLMKCPSCGRKLTRKPLSFLQRSHSTGESAPLYEDSS